VRGHDPLKTGFKIGINKFSDMTLEEFERMQGFKELPAVNKFLEDEEEEEVPKEEVKKEDGRGLLK
jgi:hypothetical protein